MLLVLYALIILRGLTITARAPTQFGRLMAGAMSMMFFIYVFVNIGMVTGILPVVGVPLPFLSYGGTALSTLAILSGYWWTNWRTGPPGARVLAARLKKGGPPTFHRARAGRSSPGRAGFPQIERETCGERG